MDGNRDTPILIAIKNNKPEVLKFLLEKMDGNGDIFNALHKQKLTSLELAIVIDESGSLFNIFIDAKLIKIHNINEINVKNNMTLLHFASLLNNYNVVREIVKYIKLLNGGNNEKFRREILKSNSKKQTALHYAARCTVI